MSRHIDDVIYRVRAGPHAVVHVHHHDLIGMTEYVSVLRKDNRSRIKADLAVVLRCDLIEGT